MWGFTLRPDTTGLHRTYSGQLVGISRWTRESLYTELYDLEAPIIASHPDPDGLLELADTLPVKPEWVALDLEGWENTPPEVRDNPVEAVQALVEEAHARGYRVMLFMARAYYQQHQLEAAEIAEFVDAWMFPAQQLQLQYEPGSTWAREVDTMIEPVAAANPDIPLWLKLHVTHPQTGSRWTAQECIAYYEQVSDRIAGCFLYDIQDPTTATLEEVLAWERA
jgi:hypothetical protein